MVGKTLRPLEELSNAIEKTDENNLFLKVHEPNSNDEVAKLSVSFNNMVSKLEKAFVAQKNFSANAAHELKTPLTAMIACVECCLLDEFPTPLEYRETLEDVLQNAERLSTLVSDLLKMNMDEAMILREKIDVKKMFEEIIAELSDDVGGNIRIDNHVGNITLHGDKGLLNRAFSNLIHNAVKYNRPGGTVEILAAQIDDTIVISILDTGIGISSDQIDKIFSPFYCVDKSRSRELGGSGLGLSIVKSIVDKHGGIVRVQSTLGTSTTVTVTLPK